MNDPLISEVLERLDADATKTGKAERLVLGALLGRLDDVIDGVVVERPVAATRKESAPVRAYLESVAVTGFRGIDRVSLRSDPDTVAATLHAEVQDRLNRAGVEVRTLVLV